MFGKKETSEEETSVVAGAKDTVIGKGTEVKGTISAEGIVRVDGKFEGELITKGDVMVGESGYLAANISARHVMVAGEVRGNVDGGGKLEITSSGKLLGDVKVNSIVISDGAIFKGSCEMRKSSGVDTHGQPALQGDGPSDTQD